MGNYTPRHLKDKVLKSRGAMEGERKRVTVLFVDLEDSIAVSRGMDPEDWHRILDGFFDIVSETVHAFEGTINQYTGDGAMALFGAPIAHEDHARRACHAALRIRDALREYTAKLKQQSGLVLGFRLGLNTGDVVVGKIGDDLRMDYTAQGYVVGIAARMQEGAESGAIFVAEETAAQVEGLCDLRPVGAIEVKGVREPVKAYELQSAHPERTRLAASTGRLSRFVGRAKEFAHLTAALERARKGRGQAVALIGGPGLGKSRLCLEFEQYCVAQGHAVYKAHGVPHGRLFSFFPVLSLMRSYLGISGNDKPEVARERIRERLEGFGGKDEYNLPRVYEYFGVADPKVALASMHPKMRQSRDLAFIRWALLEAPRDKTIVLLLEDLHWFDELSIEILDVLVRAISHSHVMLVVTSRPEFRPDFVYEGQCRPLTLEPLGKADSIALAMDVLGESAGIGDLARRAAESGGGNPFFIEEIIQNLAERGILDGTRGDYRLAGKVASLEVPSSVQDILSARVDRIPEQYKRVLQAAAVIGREFSLPVLSAVAELPPTELRSILDRLAAAEFIAEDPEHPDELYAFKHALTQEAVYHSLLRDKRAQLHARAAAAIEKAGPRQREENAALLAHHWERAGEKLKAVFAYHEAGEWAIRKDVRQSLNYRHKVMALLEGEPLTLPARRAYLAACRNILSWSPSTAEPSPHEAEGLFQRGCAIADSETLLDLALLYGAYAIYQAICHSFARGIELAEKSAELMQRAGQPLLQIYVETLAKPICYSSMGRPRQEHQICERALQVLQQKDAPPLVDGVVPLVWASAFHAISMADLGELPRAMKLLQQTAEIAREGPDIMVINLIGVQARFWYFIGDTGDAERCAEEALGLARQAQGEHWLAQAHYFRAMAHVLHEQWPEAREHFEASCRHARHGDIVFAVHGVSTAWLAYARVRTGEPDDALNLVDDALEFARQRETLWVRQEALMVRCAILRETRGRAAEPEIRDALARWDACIDENGAEMYRHLIWLERARLAEWGDYAPEVIGALQQALACAKRVGAEGYVRRIEQELQARR